MLKKRGGVIVKVIVIVMCNPNRSGVVIIVIEREFVLVIVIERDFVLVIVIEGNIISNSIILSYYISYELCFQHGVETNFSIYKTSEITDKVSSANGTTIYIPVPCLRAHY